MPDKTQSVTSAVGATTFGAESQEVKFLSSVLTDTFGEKFKISEYPIKKERLEEISKGLDHAMFEAWREDKLDKKDAIWWVTFLRVLSLGDISVAIAFVDAKPRHRNRG